MNGRRPYLALPTIAGAHRKIPAVQSETGRSSGFVTPSPAAKPISAISLMAKVLWNAIVRLFTGRKQGS